MRLSLSTIALAGLLLAAMAPAAERAPPIDADALYGRWVPDTAAVDYAKVVTDWAKLTADQRKAKQQELAKEWQDYAVALLPRVGVFALGAETVRGMWRVEKATPTTAELVIKGVDAPVAITFDGKHLLFAILPIPLPFKKVTGE